MTDDDTRDIDIIRHDPTALDRASRDTLIALARERGRDESAAIVAVHALATRSAQIAEKCVYRLERTDRRTGEHTAITGPSIRLAELVAHHWGGLDVSPIGVVDDGVQLIGRVAATDVIAGHREVAEARRPIVGRNGRRFPDHLIAQIAQAVLAVARRNAILAVVPRVLVDPIAEECLAIVAGATRREAAGGGQQWSDRVARIVARYRELGASTEQIESLAGCRVDAIGASEVARLTAIGVALRDGETTLAAELDAAGPP